MKKKILIALFLLVILIFSYSYFIEPNLLFVKIIKMDLPIEKKVKIAIFSDIHLGKFKNGISLKRVIEKVNKLEPDLVFIPGDFVFQIKDFKRLNYLSEIHAKVYAVLGNHDVGFPGEDVSEKLQSVLEENNVRLIDNTIEKIEDRGITIIGLSDLYQGRANFTLLKEQKKESFIIVLAHNPDSVYSFPANSNIDLVISGHTHGGQIRIPFLYQKMIPTEYGFNRGLYKVGNTDVIVTSGIGMIGLPFRFLIPPEIIFLEIN